MGGRREITSSAVAGESKSVHVQAVGSRIADNVIEHPVCLLKLKWELLLWRSSVARKHNRSLTLPREIFRQRRIRGGTVASQSCHCRQTICHQQSIFTCP
jgi:hypothetical protein